MLALHDGSPALNGRCIEGPGNRRMGQYHRIITRATCGSTSLGLGFIIIFFFFCGVPQICKTESANFSPIRLCEPRCMQSRVMWRSAFFSTALRLRRVVTLTVLIDFGSD